MPGAATLTRRRNIVTDMFGRALRIMSGMGKVFLAMPVTGVFFMGMIIMGMIIMDVIIMDVIITGEVFLVVVAVVIVMVLMEMVSFGEVGTRPVPVKGSRAHICVIGATTTPTERDNRRVHGERDGLVDLNRGGCG